MIPHWVSNRTVAALIVGLAINIGWFWRIADERGWHVNPLGYFGFLLLAVWLWNRLDKAGPQ